MDTNIFQISDVYTQFITLNTVSLMYALLYTINAVHFNPEHVCVGSPEVLAGINHIIYMPPFPRRLLINYD